MASPLQSADENRRPPGDKGIGDVAGELWELLKTYAKQETVDPLKGLQKFAALGVVGSTLLGLGLVLLSLGLIRLLQTETDQHLTGHLDWVPYVVTLVVAAVAIALAVRAIGKSSRGRKAASLEKERNW